VQFAGESGTLSLVLRTPFESEVRNQDEICRRYRRPGYARVACGCVARTLGILLLLVAVASVTRSGTAIAQSEGKDASLIAFEREMVTAPVMVDGRVRVKLRRLAGDAEDGRGVFADRQFGDDGSAT
jgi:hypothetical protein